MWLWSLLEIRFNIFLNGQDSLRLDSMHRKSYLGETRACLSNLSRGN